MLDHFDTLTFWALKCDKTKILDILLYMLTVTQWINSTLSVQSLRSVECECA
jgi:hypothetical protein